MKLVGTANTAAKRKSPALAQERFPRAPGKQKREMQRCRDTWLVLINEFPSMSIDQWEATRTDLTCT